MLQYLICFANVGYSPTPRQHFCKTAAPKNFLAFAMFHAKHRSQRKQIFSVRQKGVPPLLLPASVLQLSRCLAPTYNLDSYDTTLFEWDSFKKCNCSRKNLLQYLICFANVGCSPTPRQHFCKTAAPKNFLAFAMFHVKHRSQRKQIFSVRQKGVPPLLLPTSLLQLPRCLAPTYNLTSYDTTLFEWDSFQKYNCSRKNISANLICFANVGCSPTPRQHF